MKSYEKPITLTMGDLDHIRILAQMVMGYFTREKLDGTAMSRADAKNTVVNLIESIELYRDPEAYKAAVKKCKTAMAKAKAALA